MKNRPFALGKFKKIVLKLKSLTPICIVQHTSTTTLTWPWRGKVIGRMGDSFCLNVCYSLLRLDLLHSRWNILKFNDFKTKK